MIYSDNNIGSFQYNYYPEIFRKLIRNLVELSKITKKNFRIRFSQGKKDIYRFGGKMNYMKIKESS